VPASPPASAPDSVVASSPPEEELLDVVASPPSSPPPLLLPLPLDEVVASSPPLDPLAPDPEPPPDAPLDPASESSDPDPVLLDPPHPTPIAIARQSPAQALEAFMRVLRKKVVDRPPGLPTRVIGDGLCRSLYRAGSYGRHGRFRPELAEQSEQGDVGTFPSHATSAPRVRWAGVEPRDSEPHGLRGEAALRERGKIGRPAGVSLPVRSHRR
jgi:hypothetical protein